MRNNNSNTDWGEVGCVAIIGLFALPYILQSIFISLMPYLFVGGIGLIGYRLYIYDRRTGRITQYFEEQFNLSDKNKNDLLDSENEETKQISDTQLEELTLLKKEIIGLKEGQKSNEQNQKNEIEKALQQHTDKIGKEKKSEVLNQIFGKETNKYSSSDVFEKQQFEETNKKKKEELDVREIKQTVNEQLFEQNKKIHEQEVKINARVDGVESEMRTGFLEFSYKLLHLEKEFITFKGLVVERFAQVEANFEKAFAMVQEQMGNLRVELKQDIADTKVQFGKEIMRIDKQQMTIIDKMRQYEHQVKAFTVDMQKVRIEAEKFSLKGERMLQMSSTIYQRHKAEMYAQSKDIQVGLQQMAIHKGDFSNKVGQAKLMLDEISNDQYLALKDMAYERVGINMLRQEHDQRSSLEEQKMQHLLTKQQNLGEKIRIEQSHGREVSGLKHQLFLTGENLQFTRNRASLMRQEQSIMNRLTR